MNVKFRLIQVGKFGFLAMVEGASIPHEVKDASGIFFDEYTVQKRPILEGFQKVLSESRMIVARSRM